MRILLIMALTAGLLLPGILSGEENNEGFAKVEEALACENAGDFYKAAGLYLDAEFLLTDTQHKANALKSAVMCYRRAGALQKEFDTAELLMNRHANQTKYDKLVDRQYDIARAYYNGEREPAFWSLRWIPWLTGPDKTTEMLQKTLKRAPFSSKAPSARLLLAFKLNDEGKVQEAADELRTLIKDYPDAPQRKYAYLALAGVLYHLAESGDGDGSYNRELITLVNQFRTLYPDSAERELADMTLLKAKDVQAERLFGLAQYYKRTGRPEASQRYLNQILRDYPDTAKAEETEALLVKMDDTYTPDGFREEVAPRIPAYSRHAIPAEDSALLIVPENSNGRFLLPVYDISNKKAPERAENQEK